MEVFGTSFENPNPVSVNSDIRRNLQLLFYSGVVGLSTLDGISAALSIAVVASIIAVAFVPYNDCHFFLLSNY